MSTLFIIPARGGSKGIPKKNIARLKGKPLIEYTVNEAKKILKTGDKLCISTDCEEIANVVKNLGVEIPFLRPDYLSSDTATSLSVIKHAFNYYRDLGYVFQKVVLLQPTSPFRKAKHIVEALELWHSELDLLISVKKSKANPYFNLYESIDNQRLIKSKDSTITRRQDAPSTYEANGAIYIYSISYISKYPEVLEPKIGMYVMNDLESLDIDNQVDLILAEILLKEEYLSID